VPRLKQRDVRPKRAFLAIWLAAGARRAARFVSRTVAAMPRIVSAQVRENSAHTGLLCA
jgi:hypothetical protein